MNGIERHRNQQYDVVPPEPPNSDRADTFDESQFLLDHFPEPPEYVRPAEHDDVPASTTAPSDEIPPVRDYRLTVRLSIDERAALDELAQRLNIDKSAAVRTALLELLKQTPPF